MRRVREDIVGLAGFLDHGHFVRRQVLQLLLLSGVLGGDYFEARSHQHVFFALSITAGLGAGAPDNRP